MSQCPDCDHCGEADGAVGLGPLMYCQSCFDEAVEDAAQQYCGVPASDIILALRQQRIELRAEVESLNAAHEKTALLLGAKNTEVEALRAGQVRWIPCERMPEDGVRVLFIAPGWLEPSIGWREEDGEVWFDIETDSHNDLLEHAAGLVSHWQPLPAPPAATADSLAPQLPTEPGKKGSNNGT